MTGRSTAAIFADAVSNRRTSVHSWRLPVMQVLGWELRRLGSNRSTWIMLALVSTACIALEVFVGRAQLVTIPSAYGPRTFWLAYTGNWGLYNILPETPGIFLGAFLPFLTVDGVARDLRRRTHELLMTTAIPSRAYVWGRFLSTLLLSLGVAYLVLVAIVAQAGVGHLLQPDVYLAPDLPGFTAQWALIVLAPTILLGSIGFALGTVAPRSSTIIKLTIMLGWFVSGQILRWHAVAGVAAQQAAWDPTGESLAYAQTTQTFLQALASQTRTLSDQAFMTYLHTVEQRPPDMHLWIMPHLLWALVGITTVVLASLAFRRFRNALW